jgi:hypothetical protein
MYRFKVLALSLAGGCLLLATPILILQGQTESKPQTEQKQPQAKTKAEYDAYLAMYNEQDPNKKVELASKFLTDFPDTEFKPYIYQIQIATYAHGEARQSGRSGREILDRCSPGRQQQQGLGLPARHAILPAAQQL